MSVIKSVISTPVLNFSLRSDSLEPPHWESRQIVGHPDFEFDTQSNHPVDLMTGALTREPFLLFNY